MRNRTALALCLAFGLSVTLHVSLFLGYTIAHDGTAASLQTNDRTIVQFPDVAVHYLHETHSSKLLIDGVAVVEVASAHIGKHQFSADGRFLAVAVWPTGSETLPTSQIAIADVSEQRVIKWLPGYTLRWLAMKDVSKEQDQPDYSLVVDQIAQGASLLEIEEATQISRPLQGHQITYGFSESNKRLLGSQCPSHNVLLHNPSALDSAQQPCQHHANLAHKYTLDAIEPSPTFYIHQIKSIDLPEPFSQQPVGLQNNPVGLDQSNPDAGEASAPIYPETIRVMHHSQNQCRNVPDDFVSVIPFEEYVAKVVSSEVPSSWRSEALKAQAVAVRTYAWFHIRKQRQEYDVTDWANFQYMCDEVYKTSEEAALSTTALYLTAVDDADGLPILAMYSAENSHPTLTNPDPSVPYLQAVPDLYSIGRERFGHGYGLSQWGAQRRGLDNHNFAQILGHYYSGIHLRDAITPVRSLASFVEPASYRELGSASLQWRAITSSPDIFAAASPLHSTEISSTGDSSQEASFSNVRVHITASRPITQLLETVNAVVVSTTVVITGSNDISTTVAISDTQLVTETEIVSLPLNFLGAEGVWPIAEELVDGDLITISLRTGEETLSKGTLRLDHTPPNPPTISQIGETTLSDSQIHGSSRLTSTVVISRLQTSITGTVVLTHPTGGRFDDNISVASSLGWRWRGEELIHTEGSGAAIADGNARDGLAWQASVNLHDPGIWYGPYTPILQSEQSYRALFWLKTPLSHTKSLTELWSSEIIARLDVTDDEGRSILGMRDLRLGDFQQGTKNGVYSPIAVDFYTFAPPKGLEFRVAWHGRHTLALDEVQIWSLPTPMDENEFSLSLHLGRGHGARELSVATFDSAGNISAPFTTTVQSVDLTEPVISDMLVPTNVFSGSPLTITVQAVDPFSGLADAGSIGTLSADKMTITRTASFDGVSTPWDEQLLIFEFVDGLESGDYRLQIVVTDKAGNQAYSPTQQIVVEPEPQFKLFIPLI